MITSNPMLRDWLHSLPAYANQTFGRPPNPNQCCGCGRMMIAWIPALKVNLQGLCTRCQHDRAPHRDVIRLFKPLHKVRTHAEEL